MSHGQHTVADLLAAIRVESPQAFTLGGRTFIVPPAAPAQPAAVAGQAAPEQTPPLVEWLSGALYRYAYSRPFRPPLPLADPPPNGTVDAALIAEMTAANASRDRWEEGWSITQIHSAGEVTAQRGNTTRHVWPGQFLSKDGPGARPRPGALISLFYPRESTSLQSGFYYCFGETPEDLGGGFGLARAYWNVTAEGAPRLVRLLSERLNGFHVPFRLKCATLRGEYDRTDVAVLYLTKLHFPFLGELLRDVYPGLRPFLGEDVPLFARRFAAGIGIAEDPGTGESFGQHRCRVLAETCWSGFLRGDQRPEPLLAEFRQRIAAAGVEPDRLYLNLGTLDVYDPPPGLEEGAATAMPVPERGPAEGFLEVAAALGARVCRDALWASDRCNWTGFSMESLDGRWRHTHRAYGPDLYAGTSGIGLFLARLHAAAGERLFRRTALGALRNALARAEDLEPFSRIGTWSGWTGIGLAALEAADLLDEDWLREPALALLGRIAAGEVDLQSFDVLAGSAGAIPALLRAHRGLGGPSSLLEAAVRLGDHLIDTAVRSDVGWSWGQIPPGSKQKGNLTGFSHGAGGIGWALYELWNATGEERFRGAGEEAFRYERHWYDPKRRNWPDLRDPELSGGPPTDELAFMSAWCHGAPGTALSRLRVWDLTGDETCRAEAEAALAHTHEHVLGGSEMSQTNYSLCHGLGGNCDVLLQGARVLGNPDWQRRAEEIARRGVETSHNQKLPWPCGTYGSVEVPGLMLGLSGIGWFYLRLAVPEVPSALVLTF